MTALFRVIITELCSMELMTTTLYLMKSNKKISISFNAKSSKVSLPQLRGMFVSPDFPQFQEAEQTDPEILFDILLKDLHPRNHKSINVE